MIGPSVVGVDFDNTIVSYDNLFHRLGLEFGLIPQDCPADKRAIRDLIRTTLGDHEWLRLQDVAYGQRMDEAELIPGVSEFFHCCREAEVRAVIVSHKTERSNLPGSNARLRDAARSWMGRHAFFDSHGLNLDSHDVFFESGRAEKVARIAELACEVFIDDLEETLLHPAFPPSTRRILFAPGEAPSVPSGIIVLRNWLDIRDHVFSAGV